ncbi:hypothetical protein ACFW93_34375 [Streptomyces canus]|uniref:hypothetical protein n=1 Tax=Streptomyces canus TaxID=58343 RepID=UPI0036917CCA
MYTRPEDGGRRVRIGDHFVGITYGLLDIAAYLQEAGLQDWDEMDVARSGLIEWRGGGPSGTTGRAVGAAGDDASMRIATPNYGFTWTVTDGIPRAFAVA